MGGSGQEGRKVGVRVGGCDMERGPWMEDMSKVHLTWQASPLDM